MKYKIISTITEVSQLAEIKRFINAIEEQEGEFPFPYNDSWTWVCTNKIILHAQYVNEDLIEIICFTDEG